MRGKDQVLFGGAEYGGWRKYERTIHPVETDTLRLVISFRQPGIPQGGAGE